MAQADALDDPPEPLYPHARMWCEEEISRSPGSCPASFVKRSRRIGSYALGTIEYIW